MAAGMTDVRGISCRISVDCTVNPSEDLQKVRQALANVVPGLEFAQEEEEEEEGGRMRADSADLRCLDHLCGRIHDRRAQRSFRKQIRQNMRGDSFWFYLNKQAAFAGTVALCEREDESPLGPIRISVRSGQIDSVAEMLLLIRA